MKFLVLFWCKTAQDGLVEKTSLSLIALMFHFSLFFRLWLSFDFAQNIKSFILTFFEYGGKIYVVSMEACYGNKTCGYVRSSENRRDIR